MCVRQQKIPVMMLICEWCKNSQKRLGHANASRMLLWSNPQSSYCTLTGTAVDRLRPGSQYRYSYMCVLQRRANPLGGRRLCPRFADHTGRLTSFNTPYLSLLPSWAGEAAQTTQAGAGGAPAKGCHAPSHFGGPTTEFGIHIQILAPKKRVCVQSSAPAVPPAP